VLSVFGALTMYIVSMLALFRLRKREPNLERPYRSPLYPYLPAFALSASVVCLASMVYNYRLLAGLFAGLLAMGYGYFRVTEQQRRAR
jgi:ethanolamine permease